MLLSQKLVQSESLSSEVHDQCFTYPERVIQIGEGNFLRAFADWVIHRLNQRNRFGGRIVVASPRAHGHATIEQLNAQDSLYTVWLRGVQNGKIVDDPEVITSVSRGIDPSSDWQAFLKCAESFDIQFVISNTTEAGLTYKPEDYSPSTPLVMFPARLTAYLYHRYQTFDGRVDAGMTIIPCELVEENGDRLKELVLHYAADWNLSTSFIDWVNNANQFCNTLVDRIVTGKPSDLSPQTVEARLGYEDNLVTVAEPFHLWVIQGDARLSQALGLQGDENLNVHIVEDVNPFRLKKVRILNGAHTAMAPVAHFAGIATVGEVVEDKIVGGFIQTIIGEEIVPALRRQGVSEDESKSFAKDVWERFSNPFLRHQISSLMLNGLSKVRARLLPTIEDYVSNFAEAPKLMATSFAATLLYYKNADSVDGEWEIQDEPELVEQIQQVWKAYDGQDVEIVTSNLLSLKSVWGCDLTKYPNLCEYVTSAIEGIQRLGMKAYLVAMSSD